MKNNQMILQINNLENIGGHIPEIIGNPSVKNETVEFDGERDALKINIHPLEGAEKFTIETVFRPDEGGLSEQRYFHIQDI